MWVLEAFKQWSSCIFLFYFKTQPSLFLCATSCTGHTTNKYQSFITDYLCLVFVQIIRTLLLELVLNTLIFGLYLNERFRKLRILLRGHLWGDHGLLRITIRKDLRFSTYFYNGSIPFITNEYKMPVGTLFEANLISRFLQSSHNNVCHSDFQDTIGADAEVIRIRRWTMLHRASGNPPTLKAFTLTFISPEYLI